jgi:hypothetical protein
MRDQTREITEIPESKKWQPLYRDVLPKGLFVYILIITTCSYHMTCLIRQGHI